MPTRLHRTWKTGLMLSVLGMVVPLSAIAFPAWAVDWPLVPVQLHSDFQAMKYVDPETGWTSDYQGGFPLRLRGVVLNANEDWLDPTAAYDAGYHIYNTGGQAEFFVQAVDADDFGGAFCWMGQNYGNMPWIHDPKDNYFDAQWYDELNRLHLWHPSGADLPDPLSWDQIIRPGDYVEIRALGGLYYSGKMNVNEEHSISINRDFEVVVLQKGRGWDAPVNLALSDLKNPDDSFIFDTAAPRNSGAEHYQGSLVVLQNVHFTGGTWGPDRDVTVADATGRPFSVHLSRGAGFSAYGAPTGNFNVSGTMDQDSETGDGGYRLLAMNSGDLFKHWTNGSGSGAWNNAANWDGNGSVPSAGEGVHFAGAGGGIATNNLPAGQAVGGIEFETGAGSFTLAGNALTLTGNLVSFSPNTQTVATAITLSGEEKTVYAAAGDLVIENDLQNNAYLRKIGSGTVRLPGGIYGSGTLDVCNGALTASSIVQGTLIIGGNAGSGEDVSASDVKTVPEPSSGLMLLSAGLLCFWSILRIKKKGEA
jgi:hypothetical protein